MVEGVVRDVEAFSSMVAGIYDAALDPGLWPAALGIVRDFAGGQCATLFSKDVLSLTGGVFHDDGGIDPGYRQAYFDQFIRLDPASTAQYYAQIDEPMATADLLSYDEFLTTRFYREWAKPQGLVDFASVALEKSSTAVSSRRLIASLRRLLNRAVECRGERLTLINGNPWSATLFS